MTNRRSFILALTAAALTPTVTYAAEAGDIFGNILQGIKDRKEREWYEKHRDEGRWDGKYYWDREDNKRYTRDEWRRYLEERYRGERGGGFRRVRDDDGWDDDDDDDDDDRRRAAVRVGTGMTTMTMIDRFSCGREVESLPCAHVP